MEPDAGYPDGFDAEWLAVDRHGHIAVFFTGGQGPVPESLFRPPGYADRWIAWRDQLYLTPRHTEALLVPTGAGYGELIQYSGRGIHVFDWTDCTRRAIDHSFRYERFSTPGESATNGHDLPEDLAARILGIDFSTVERIDVTGCWPCLFPTPHA